ncbi:VOC family protein [Sphingomonas sp. TREG-RG-20F-R18-01]|uniref:VOC family protein n=1 Tax=Sphingomonas sp. TREG-RG-20F-R18-01 TaxID=2914982 RepID=UPI001F55F3FF|nr:VOC family protein [Sphingomonas sp. TREG-RG-20F-R18-01]
MPRVFRLAYVDLATPSLDDARAYYDGVLGATTVQQTGDAAYLSLGLDHHNIALRKGDRPGLTAIGLQVGPGVELPDLQRRIAEMGLRVESKSDARPGVPRLLEVTDLGGHTFQLLPEIAAAGPGFSGRGVDPVRVGHVAILTTDASAVLGFLTNGLGFSTTDWFEDFVTFVTCNRDHHVLNVIQAPFATLHHLAFQLEGRDHQFRAADHLAREKVPTLWGPSRHTAGHNVASYHHGADSAVIELYNDMDVFIPEMGMCEPRPWHGDLPQRPKHWPITEMTRWETRYEFDFVTAALGGPPEL